MLCGVAAIATAACAAPVSATASAVRAPTATVAATGVPVVVDCAAQRHTRPGQYRWVRCGKCPFGRSGNYEK